MTRRPIPASHRLRRLWASRFWILAATLGAITIYTAVTTIHDGNQRGLAAGLVTQATAMHASTLASARLERLALEAFAPIGPLAPSPAGSPSQATVDALASRQRNGMACACRELLPVSRFFQHDVASGAFVVAPVEVRGDTATAVLDSLLAKLTRVESREPRGVSNASSRLVVHDRLGHDAVVTLVQRDDRGTPLAVYGIVVKKAETLAALFSRGPHRSAIDSAGLTRLDSLSYEVRTTDGSMSSAHSGAVGFARSSFSEGRCVA